MTSKVFVREHNSRFISVATASLFLLSEHHHMKQRDLPDGAVSLIELRSLMSQPPRLIQRRFEKPELQP